MNKSQSVTVYVFANVLELQLLGLVSTVCTLLPFRKLSSAKCGAPSVGEPSAEISLDILTF